MHAIVKSEIAADRTPAKRAALVRIAPWGVLAAMLAVPALLTNFVVFQLTLLLIYAIAVLALNLLTGASGQFSLGQSAFYAVGAYTSAILIESHGVHYALTPVIAGGVCFVCGSLFGRPALRLSGIYLALATFALAAALPQLLKLSVLEHWTGGVQGLVVTKPDPPFGIPIHRDTWLYYFTLVMGLAIYIMSVNLLRSRSGRTLLAIRDNEIAASAMGVNVALFKTLAFGVSAAFTGVAGALSAIVVQFVAPDSYPISLAIAIFLGMIVGGIGWLPGSLVGAAFIIFVPNIAESVSKGLSGAIYGVLLFLIIFLMPRGAHQVATWIEQLVKKRPGVPRSKSESMATKEKNL